ncbi:RICIN domain-containing protein [Aquimarina sp. RZ0]|uniref:RICIN domain-containing protein n=1 Tax=Aquimarina sp. RZ0 TaxID=2607730 RepID=UPI0011F1DF6F|nr:RICIN domain-containing protein [Aquimarina sp. RZ0]KAA1248086.1 RICIN domain-containing protein [Aquimarina sp. RZ0]
MKTNSISNNLKNYALSVFVLFFSASFAMNANQVPADNSNDTSLNQIDPNLQFLLRNKTNERKLISLDFTFIYVPYSLVFNPKVEEGDSILVAELGSSLYNEQIERFEKWRFVNLGNSVYQIINIESAKAIDVENNNATPIQSTPDTADAGQRWEVVTETNGFLRFVNQQTGKALAFEDNKLVQSTINSNADQQWKIDETIREEGPGSIPEINPIELDLVIAPNPVRDFTTAVINSNQEVTVIIEGRSWGAKLLDKKEVTLAVGENRIQLDMRNRFNTTRFGFVEVIRKRNGERLSLKTIRFQQ